MRWGDGIIPTLSVEHLKLVEKFMYICSSILFTENDVNIHLVKVWTAINHMEV